MNRRHRFGMVFYLLLAVPLKAQGGAERVVVEVLREEGVPTYALLLERLREARPGWRLLEGTTDIEGPVPRPPVPATGYRLVLGGQVSAATLRVSLVASASSNGLASALTESVAALFPGLRKVALLDPDGTLATGPVTDSMRAVRGERESYSQVVERVAPQVEALVLADGAYRDGAVDRILQAAARARLPVFTTAPWVAAHRVALAVVPDLDALAVRVACDLETKAAAPRAFATRRTVNLDRIEGLTIEPLALPRCDRILGRTKP